MHVHTCEGYPFNMIFILITSPFSWFLADESVLGYTSIHQIHATIIFRVCDEICLRRNTEKLTKETQQRVCNGHSKVLAIHGRICITGQEVINEE